MRHVVVCLFVFVLFSFSVLIDDCKGVGGDTRETETKGTVGRESDQMRNQIIIRIVIIIRIEKRDVNIV